MTPAEPGEEDASERPLRETRRLLGPTLLALLAFALLALLGFWQLGRDAERNQDWRATQEDGAQPALGQADLDKGDDHVMWRRVRLHAVFEDGPMLLSGSTENHRPGFQVMQLATLDDGKRILVDRGFVAHGGVEDGVNAYAPDGEGILVEGRVRPLTDSRHEKPYPRMRGIATVWPPRSRASMAPHRWYILTGEAPVTYDWTSLHYAAQWFGLALLVLGGWGAWLWVRLGHRLPWSSDSQGR